MTRNKTKTVRRISDSIDKVHVLRAEGLTDHKVIERLLQDGLDMFEAGHALAQAKSED
jgi:hypothetical protein